MLSPEDKLSCGRAASKSGFPCCMQRTRASEPRHSWPSFLQRRRKPFVCGTKHTKLAPALGSRSHALEHGAAVSIALTDVQLRLLHAQVVLCICCRLRTAIVGSMQTGTWVISELSSHRPRNFSMITTAHGGTHRQDGLQHRFAGPKGHVLQQHERLLIRPPSNLIQNPPHLWTARGLSAAS